MFHSLLEVITFLPIFVFAFNIDCLVDCCKLIVDVLADVFGVFVDKAAQIVDLEILIIKFFWFLKKVKKLLLRWKIILSCLREQRKNDPFLKYYKKELWRKIN